MIICVRQPGHVSFTLTNIATFMPTRHVGVISFYIIMSYAENVCCSLIRKTGGQRQKWREKIEKIS